jgi:formylglycine-generating enzyme required for sulfatase activity
VEKTVKKKIVENYIAVFDLQTRGKVDKDISYPLSESIRKELVHSGKYEVIDRDNMDKILTEQKFQLSGCTASACIVDAGQLLGVGKIITGSVSILGKTYYLSLSLVNVETGKIENVSEDTCKCEIDELIDASKRLAQRLLGVTVATGPPTGTKTPMEPPKAPGVAPSVYKDTVTGIELVFVKGGCFQMGDAFGDGFSWEKPVHEVCVDDFSLGKHEVTIGQFKRFVNATNYRTEAEKGDGCYVWTGSKWELDRSKNWQNPGFYQTDTHPVVCVSWNDTQEFISWLNRQSSKQYRLPTEAEWEYAARSGGKKYKYSWGNGQPSGNIADESSKRQFNWSPIWDGYDDGYIYTAPVGNYRPNELELYDMTGNVWERVSDWYGEKYYANSPKDNPKGPSSGTYRVLRGGGWSSEPRYVRAANRGGVDPVGRVGFGFRIAVSGQ